jgi:TPR repeat protein
MKKYLIYFILFLFPLTAMTKNKKQETLIDSLKYTKTEKEQLSKWKHDLVPFRLQTEALKGNLAANHILGLYYQKGKGFYSQDEQKAIDCFSKSASFGFEPSIYYLMQYYFKDNKNIYLATVYLKLISSMNHPELIKSYNRVKAFYSKNYPHDVEKLFQKIESITEKKKKLIEKNRKKLNATDKKYKFIKMQILCRQNSITGDDEKLNDEYWEN